MLEHSSHAKIERTWLCPGSPAKTDAEAHRDSQTRMSRPYLHCRPARQAPRSSSPRFANFCTSVWPATLIWSWHRNVARKTGVQEFESSSLQKLPALQWVGQTYEAIQHDSIAGVSIDVCSAFASPLIMLVKHMDNSSRPSHSMAFAGSNSASLAYLRNLEFQSQRNQQLLPISARRGSIVLWHLCSINLLLIL